MVSQQLPAFVQDEVVIGSEKLLKTRVILRDSQRVMQELIKWFNMTTEEATWEDQAFILQQSPEFQSS